MLIATLLVLMQMALPHTEKWSEARNASVVFENFESNAYPGWEVRGSAFGETPAKGRIGKQREVAGFVGGGLVNSYLGGDKATGSLMSKPFTIEHKWITFLMGGGMLPETAGMRLWVDGLAVRTATGVDDENLVQQFWEVQDLQGKTARIEIFDHAQGQWGHINVDEIVFSDTLPKMKKTWTRTIRVKDDFLHLPLMQRERGAKPGIERLTFEQQELGKDLGNVVRYVHVEFPPTGKKPDFWYAYDMRELKGKDITLRYKSLDSTVLDRLEMDNDERIRADAYEGKYRPRFHFSPRIGWMNDVNGTYYLDGEYHLFYQANPTTAGRSTGFDMHWGHSVSTDLLHWKEMPIALFPNEQKGQAGKCYSGTAVIVHESIPGVTEGLQLPTPVLFFTANSNQLMATSRTQGRTWERYPGNPVLPVIGNASRDPKVLYHPESKAYVMVVYVAKEAGGREEGYRFYRSTDLVHWTLASIQDHWYECPEFLPVRSAVTGETLWMLYGCYRPKGGPNYASAYQLGRYDGFTFTPIAEVKPAHAGTSFYGALCFTNEPSGRAVMMGWMKKTEFPGEEFNQCATVPLMLSLKKMAGEDRLCYEPVPELNQLREPSVIQLQEVSVAQLNAVFAGLAMDACADVVLRIRPSQSGSVRIRVRDKVWTLHGTELTYENQTRNLHFGDTVDVRFLLDRGVIECFWNGGEAAYAVGALDVPNAALMQLEGDTLGKDRGVVERAEVYTMRNIWK